METPEMWEKVEDLRKQKYAEKSSEENSMDLDAVHKEIVDPAGNR